MHDTQQQKSSSASGQAWFRTILDSLPFPCLLVDTGTATILFANKIAAAMPYLLEPPQRTSTSAASGKLEPSAVTKSPIHELAAGGMHFRGEEFVWELPEGSRCFLAYSEFLPVEKGEATAALLTFSEVTGLKQTEHKLREAVTARDQFFSVATHELKDPLFSLKLSLDLVAYQTKRGSIVQPEKISDQLAICSRQVHRLTQRIDNLLDVSRIQNRALKLDLEAFDLDELVQEVAERFRPQAEANGASITVESCGSTIGYWDRMKVDQVVSNLVSNAVKYGDSKPIHIRLTANESYAWLDVEDQGIGIAASDLSRVFERFERAATDHKERSLGLGLYIVRSLVEAHGGSIEVQSQVGCGSKFAICLPRKRLHSPASPV